jgi:alcohol dehydrogenase
MSIRHATLNPARYAVLDPIVLETLPAHVAMHSGIDAFVHAFESYISLRANSFTDALTLDAVSRIGGSIRQFVAKRSTGEAGAAMLAGSALAGMAFGQTGLGNVHCLARFIGAAYGLSHGLSNAVCLVHVAAFNRIATPAKYARVAVALGCDVRGLSDFDASLRAVNAIETLCDDLGVPKRLREVGAKEEDFEEMAQHCVEANYNRWNPRHTTKADFLALLKAAF